MALVPDVVKKLVSTGWEVCVQSRAGTEAVFSDAAYTEAGATVAPDVAGTVSGAGLVVRVNAPSVEDVAGLPQGTTLLSFFGVAESEDALRGWPPRASPSSASTCCPASAGPRAWTPSARRPPCRAIGPA